ncbi:MAG: phage shock protein PspC (stress-responsive transcriptional regulator) [Spirosomataceae bacterium]|jgi:phage shock protein PspC (stress-responsive transcriptional regulator)
MKKTIQINIAGVVFYIEEDAYTKLNNYLKSVQAYFANYEGSQEIISDIEARIAEKFLEKGAIDGQVIISNSEVDTLILSMGTVADFEALEEEGDFEAAKKVENSGTYTDTDPDTAPPAEERKRIYRDTKRKALGGVLSGLAHYFNIDVTWVRIIFLLLVFGLSPITESAASGFFIIAYIICWVAFPPNNKLEEDPKIKKFYRNPEGKVVGGVASGLSAYFGIDIAIIRLIFVLSGFFGAGIIAYIILWVSAPEAATLTQKMEMKGEPVTLENIESNVKRSLNVPQNAPENTITRILLFPFRIIATVLRAIGNLLSNLGPILRILIGVFLLILGGALAIGIIAATAAFFGIATNETWLNGSHEVGMLAREISPWTGFFGFLTTFLPAVTVALLGVSLIANRQVISRNLWLSGLGVWFIGLVGATTIGTNYSLNFAREATYEEIQAFTMPDNILFLDSDELSEGTWQDDIRVRLESSNGLDLRLEKSFEASGATRGQALENAREINYQTIQRDSTIVFDRHSNLPDGASFRNQKLRMRLYIPQNRPFKMSPSFAYNVLSESWRLSNKNSIDLDEINKFTFEMKGDNEIICLDCPVLSDEEREEYERNNDGDSIIDGYAFEGKRDGFSKTYEIEDFSSLDVSNAFYVMVRQGSKYSVEVVAERESDLNDVEVELNGNTLNVEFEDIFISDRSKVYVYITMPTLKKFDMSGAVQAKVIDFENLKQLDISMSGASRAAIDVETDDLTVDLNGACRLDIRGRATKADFDVSGASRVNAKKIRVKRAKAEASGASSINFGRVDNLDSDTSGASKVTRQ